MLPPFARLIFDHDRTYEMRKKNIIIGRGTTSSPVDVDVGPSAFISRKHLELSWGLNVLRLKCNGKNGIFVDQNFKPFSSTAYTIPASCILRFPSTSIFVNVKQCRLRGKISRKRRRLDNRSLSPNNYITPTTGDSDLSEAFPDSPSIRPKSNCQLSSDTDHDTRDIFVTDASTSSCPTTSTNLANDQSRTRRKQTLVPKDRITPKTHPLVQRDGDALQTGTQDSGGLPLQDGTVSQQQELSESTEAVVGDAATGQSLACSPPAPTQSVAFSRPSTGSRILVASLTRLSQASASLPAAQTLIRLTEMTGLERGDRETKPPYSYAQLIAQAITSQPNRQLTLSGIYDYISQNYPYYQPHDKGWQNSVRHNLSLNRYFIKIQRSQDDHGKGCFWRIDPAYEVKVMNLAFRKRHTRGCGAVFLSAQPSTSSLLAGAVRQLPFLSTGGAPLATTGNMPSQVSQRKVVEVRPSNTAVGQLRFSFQSADSTRAMVPVNIVTSHINSPKTGNVCYHVIKSNSRNSPSQPATIVSQLEKTCDSKPACLLVFRQRPNTILSVNASEQVTTEQPA